MCNIYKVVQCKGINIIEPHILELRAKTKALKEQYDMEIVRINSMSEDMLLIEMGLGLNRLSK